jgi:hypothetical protein
LDIFEIGSHRLLSQDWLQMEILLISASRVAKVNRHERGRHIREGRESKRPK